MQLKIFHAYKCVNLGLQDEVDQLRPPEHPGDDPNLIARLIEEDDHNIKHSYIPAVALKIILQLRGAGKVTLLFSSYEQQAREIGQLNADKCYVWAIQEMFVDISVGHEVYIVGGAVRDLVLQIRPKDFDILTSANPLQVTIF